MNKYLSTFISGFDSFISEQLLKDVPDAKIIDVLDGAILYKSHFTVNEIKTIKYFNNSFVVLEKFELGKADPKVLNKMLESTIKNPKIVNGRDLSLNTRKTFRIFTSLENNLTSVDNELLFQVERIISQNLHLRKDIKNPDYEFWYLYRSENIGFFMFRVTYDTAKLEQGQLRSELTNILALLSNPKSDDVVLDPFAGSGAIPIERARVEKFKGIFALDKNIELAKKLRDRLKNFKNKRMQKSFFAKGKDFFEAEFDDGFFNAIITDPPWGYFEEIKGSVENFYKKILEKSFKILKKDGRLILLTAKKDEFDNCIKNFEKFELVEKYNILVSGKKCGVYVLAKK